MQISDLILLAKKIAVGVVVTVAPLALLIGVLRFTQHSNAQRMQSAVHHSTEVSHAN